MALPAPQHPQSQLHKFEYQKPNDEQTARIQDLRIAFRQLELQIETLIPVSQERSVATTKLREVMMWANAAVVFNGGPPTDT